jgi:hypothetical protein
METTINTYKDLLSLLSSFKPGQNRKSDREEICLYLFLYSQFNAGLIEFPITYEKRESPDFKITDNNIEIGLEISGATHPQYNYALDKLRNDPDAIFLESDFTPGVSLPKDGVLGLIRSEGQSLRTSGHMGNQAQIEWVEYFSNAIISKSAKLNGKWTYFSSNELFVFDDTPVEVAIDCALILFDPAIDQLRQDKRILDLPPQRFNRVHVMSKNVVHINAFGDAISISVSGYPYP